MSDGSWQWDGFMEPPQATPYAMTREELEYLLEMAEINAERFAHPILAHDAAQRRTIAQQVQEIETLNKVMTIHAENAAKAVKAYAQEIERLTASYDADMKHWTERLAAMTTERDAWKDSALDYLAKCAEIQQLQAHLTASEQEAGRLCEALQYYAQTAIGARAVEALEKAQRARKGDV